jgi:hypothetical protein
MKTGPDALGTAENESGRARHENENRRPRYRRKRDSTHLVPPKTSTGVQNMKTGHDALGAAENESVRAKNENGT